MAQTIGPKELAARAMTAQRALDAEADAKAARAAERAKPKVVEHLREKIAKIPVKKPKKTKQ